MSLVYLDFSSGVYLYFRILMYVNRHEQIEIGCGAILNNILCIIIKFHDKLNISYNFFRFQLIQ